MNFNEAAVCFSVGFALLIFLVAFITTPVKKGVDLEAIIFVAAFFVAIVGGCLWCLIVGTHWLIKAW